MDEKRDIVLQLENIVKTFQNGDSIITAVNGISFVLERGEMLAVMGSSGSGKSTMWRLEFRADHIWFILVLYVFLGIGLQPLVRKTAKVH